MHLATPPESMTDRLPEATHTELRARAKKARRSMSDWQRQECSTVIARRFLNDRSYRSARRIACYLPTWDEVDTRSVIAQAWRSGKKIFLPVIDGAHVMRFTETHPDTVLTLNRYGIWQPEADESVRLLALDLVVTPVVVFDDSGHRIGMGGGFYDRCFRHLKHRRFWLRPKLVGFAFSCQRTEKILPNPWDIRMSQVFSDR